MPNKLFVCLLLALVAVVCAQSNYEILFNRPDITGLTGGGATKLDGIPTTGLAVGTVLIIYDGSETRIYRLTAGTDAESSPTIIRPDDFANPANAKVWKARISSSPTETGYSGDNLGNHTATQNIRLNGHYLSNSGGNEGIYVDATGNTGIGTATPGSDLQIQGNLDVPLTGVVTVGPGSSTVTGVGTSFTTQLIVNDAIKIGSEVFTVSVITSNTNLTLDSPHTAGALNVTAYKDGNLFSVNNGDQVSKLVVDKRGTVGIGTTTPGAALEIAGQVKITGGTPGNGKVLTSDAAGLATWQTPSSSGASKAAYDIAATGSYVTLTWSYQTIQSKGITVGGAGTILIHATGDLYLNVNTAVVGISKTDDGVPLTSSEVGNADTHSLPFAVQYAEHVASAGTYTYYCVAEQSGGANTIRAYPSVITVLFVPD